MDIIIDGDEIYEDLGKMPSTYSYEKARLVSPFINKKLIIPVKVGVDPTGVEYEYEATPYVKHYCNWSLTDNPLIGLEPKALALYYYITMSIKWGEDCVWVNRKLHQRLTGMSDVTYRDAVDILEVARIIATTRFPNLFNINPQFFFKGNRVNKYPDNTKQVANKSYRSFYKIINDEE